MAELLTDQVAFLPQGPVEPSTTRTEAYNLLIIMGCKGGSEGLIFQKTLFELLSDQLEGCGKVDVHKIDVRATTTGANQKIQCGVFNANATMDSEMISQLPSGFGYVSNSYNYGTQQTHTVAIPDIYSRQIQPASATVPPLKFYLTASAKAIVSIHFYLIVSGPRIVRYVKDFP